jgi:hypothetical protein
MDTRLLSATTVSAKAASTITERNLGALVTPAPSGEG